MRLEFINRIKENEVLGRSILWDDGQVLLRAGVKLSRNYIEKLKQLGVYFIYVEDERLSDVKVEDERLSQIKRATLKSISKVIKGVNTVGSKELKESCNKVEELVHHIVETGDVNKSLYDIKTYDNYTYLHCLETGIMSTFLGITAGLDKHQLKDLAIGAILHDVGKMNVSYEIIGKDGKLTDEEYEEVKKHPIYGRRILEKKLWMSEDILKAVEQHHERVDGRGYPYGLRDKAISKFGKIVAICDVYDAVSSNRCYRKRFSPNDAYELILAGSSSAFDKELVNKFKETFCVYPLGCCVKLSNGSRGYVVNQNSGFPDRPVVRVFYDENENAVSFYEINLLSEINIRIEEVAL
ncbi:HD-GYP domain-containing protein [Haloimpatiens sp. FM7330]|uniref:HD-GYP domain-containing protein n=1 Tax=Haloimpatiens sp. FM7330 TaxID=3298610 RepID=UPI003637300C